MVLSVVDAGSCKWQLVRLTRHSLEPFSNYPFSQVRQMLLSVVDAESCSWQLA